MKKLRAICVVLGLIAISMISGCGSKVVEAVNSMTHINQAVSAFGPPSNIMPMPDGGSIYVWSSRQVVAMPSYQPTNQQYYGYGGTYLGSSYGGNWSTQYVEGVCEVRIMTTSSGIIISRSVQGNNCP